MLPCMEEGGKRTLSHIRWFALALIPASLAPAITGLSGLLYFIGALLCGLALLWVANGFIRTQSEMTARKLIRASVLYIPVLLIFILLDGTFKFTPYP